MLKSQPKVGPDGDLASVARESGIEYFLVCFVDIMGVLRSKMVPASAIAQIQKEGAGFTPHATWLNYGPDAPDMVAIPDPSTLIQVPFQPTLGFVMGDLMMDGRAVEDAPRWVLKQQIAKASSLGFMFKTGVEPEFFLLSSAPSSSSSGADVGISDSLDRQTKPRYDCHALMRRYDVLKEIVDCLNAAGFGVYQSDHEDANGQFEINWHYSDCLTTADRLVFFKWVVKRLAEKHGFRATFMPKPFSNLTGSGMHCHCSLWKGDVNLFCCPRQEGTTIGAPLAGVHALGLSEIALHFMGGVLNKAQSFCAITNPSVNSYKRLSSSTALSGATWCPNRISASGNNRTHMIRVPAPDRFEVRLADGAANPYLLPAVLLVSGLAGIEHKAVPTGYFFPPSVNMHNVSDTAPEVMQLPKLPTNLLDALRLLEKDTSLRQWLGMNFTTSFLKLKHEEWQSYAQHLSQWELEHTLDC